MKNKRYLFLITIFLSLILIFNILKVNVNLTSSMPYGFYIKSSGKIEKGDYVSLCLTKKYQQIGLQRGYIEPGNGCNGSIPLVKKVVSLPFESITLTDNDITVSGHKLAYKTLYTDSKYRPLSVYPRGTFKENCYWVVGDSDIAHSWDSRYWGCITEDQIITKLKPFLIW